MIREPTGATFDVSKQMRLPSFSDCAFKDGQYRSTVRLGTPVETRRDQRPCCLGRDRIGAVRDSDWKSDLANKQASATLLLCGNVRIVSFQGQANS
jgi:hypothetical protein